MRRPKGALPPNQLIELVHACPALWDTSHPDYCRSPVAKELKWREIAAVIDMPTQILKSKWKNLRDSYAKHLRAQAGDEEALPGRYRTYAWSREMQFIAPFLSVRLAGVPLRPAAVAELVGGGGAPPPRIKAERGVRRRRLRRLAALAAAPASSAAADLYRGLRDLDANELIFHGYAKILKKFSARRQMETRSKIMKILAEAEAQHLEESGAEDSGEEEEEGDEGAGRGRDPLVAKTEPLDDDDDSHYFES